MAITRFNAKNGLSVGTGSIGVVDSVGNAEFQALGVTGSITPAASGLYDIGSSTRQWRNMFVTNISGSITGSGLLAGQVVVAGTGGVLSGTNLFTYDGNISVSGALRSTYSSGDEGGELFFSRPQTNTSINTGVTIDMYQNKIRIFETGGTNRGGYFDISSLAAGVASNLASSPGGSDTHVQFNDGGSFGGNSNFTFTKSTNLLKVSNISGSITSSNVSAGQIVLAGVGGVLSGSNDFWWDNTNRRVGIGTSTSLSYPLTVNTSTGTSVAFVRSGDASGAALFLGDSSGILGQFYMVSGGTWIDYNTSLRFRSGYGGTERMRIDSSGNVGIGASTIQTYSGYTVLDIDNATNSGLVNFKKNGTTTSYLHGNGGLTLLSTSGNSLQIITAGSNPIYFRTNATDRVLIDSSGNLTPYTDNTYDLGSSSLRWRNMFATNISGSLTGSNVAAGQIVIAGTGGVLSGSNNFWWDNTNVRVGIGTSTVSRSLTLSRNTESSSGQLELRTVGSISTGNFDGLYFTQGASGATALGSFRVVNLSSGNPDLAFYTRDSGFNTESEKLRILNGGNVGIGITNPSVRLDIASGSMRGYYYLSTYDGELLAGADSGGYYYATGFSKNTAIPVFIGSNATSIIMSAGGSERVRIVGSNGNVGIGTNAPTIYSGFTTLAINNSSTGGVLDLMAGGTRHGTFYATAAGTYAGSISSTFFGLLAAGVERVRIDSSGNVGIGTNTYSARLFISGSSTASTPTAVIREGVASPTGGVGVLDVQNSSGTSLMFLSGSGWFGLGTNSPSQKMHISNNGSVYTQWQDTSGGGLIGYVGANAGGGVFEISSPSPVRFWVNNAERARIDTSGNVGIGTPTYTARLFVSGSSTASTPTMIVREGVVSPTGGVGVLNVQNSVGSSLLFVSGSGNVGIGMTTPDAYQKLTVWGGNVHIQSTAAAPGVGARLILSDSNFLSFVQSVMRGSSSELALGTDNTEKVRIDGSGNVGIGTSAMDSKLVINGNTVLSGTLNPDLDASRDFGSSTKRWRTIFAANISGSLTGSNVTAGQVVVAGTGGVLSGSNNLFWNNSSGSLGIGTSSSTAKFEVVGVSGSLFSVTDQLSGSLFSVNTISGLPIMEVFSDNTVVAGAYGSNALVVTGSNVGIGISLPQAKLDIRGAASTYTLLVSGSTTFGSSFGQIINAGSNSGDVSLRVRNYNGTSDYFMVRGDGNVGIATASPLTSAGNGLTIYGPTNGSLYLQNSSNHARIFAQGNELYIDNGTGGSAGSIIFRRSSSTTESARIDSSGNLGVGTNNPGTRLDVAGAARSTYGVFSGSLAAYASSTGALYAYYVNSTSVLLSAADNSATAAPLDIFTGATRALRVDTSQNVGIGTVTYTARLFVSGTSTASTPTMVVREGVANPTGGADILDVQNYLGTSIMVVTGSGRVGIGTTNPTTPLHVNATGTGLSGTGFRIADFSQDQTNGRGIMLGYDSSGQIGLIAPNSTGPVSSLAFWTNSATGWGERMRLDSVGNVGIGSTTPGSQLDIRGVGGYRVQLGYESPAFGVAIQAAASAWARYYSFQDSSNNILGSFGGYGGSNTLTYLFIGAAYNNTALRADPSTGNVSIGNVSGASRFYVTGSSTASTPTMVVKEGVASPAGGVGVFDVQNSAGTSLLFVSGSGNVGIGMTSPTARIHVYSSNVPARGQIVVDSPNGDNSQITFYSGGTTNTGRLLANSSGLLIGTTTATYLSLETWSAERIRIDSLGNVGIGTNAMGDKLAVNGSTSITGSLLPGQNLTHDIGSTSKYWRDIYARSGSYTGDVTISGNLTVAGTQTIVNSETVNIKDNIILLNSTASPQQYGGIYVADTTANTTGSLRWNSSTDRWEAGLAGSEVALPTGSGTTGYLTRWASSSTFGNSVVYDDGTNVGINTTSPSATLQLGEVSVIGQDINSAYHGANFTSVGVNRIKANFAVQTMYDSAAGRITFRRAPAGNAGTSITWSTSMAVDSSGNVGIGVTGVYPAISSRFEVTGSGATSSTSTAHFVNSSGTSLFFVRDDGNVGIGTNNPSNTLDVRGRIYTTNSFFAALGAPVYMADSGALSNVSIDSPAAGQMRFRIANSSSEAMRIDSSGNVGINTTSMTLKLEVSGSDARIHDVRVGRGSGSDALSTAVGFFALNAQNAGDRQNTAVGAYSLVNATTGQQNTAVGVFAGNSVLNTNFNTAIGAYAGVYLQGSNNVSVGRAAHLGVASVSLASNNTAVGQSAAYSITTGGNNTSLGANAGYSNTTGADNLFAGYQAGFSNSTASGGVALGYQAGYYNASGSYNISIGYAAGMGVSAASTTGIENVSIGYSAGRNLTSGIRNVLIGSVAGNSMSTGGANVGVGYAAAYRVTTNTEVTAVGNLALAYNTGASNTAIGDESLRGFDGLSTGGGNTAIGANSGVSVTTGTNNSIVGSSAGLYLTTGTANTFMGLRAGQNTSVGGYNVAIGIDASVLNRSGSFNTSVGYQAGYSSLTTSNLTSIGGNANLYQTGTGLVAVGYGSLAGISGQSTGTNNTAVGYQAGSVVTTGGNNFFGGYQAGVNQSVANQNVLVGTFAGYSVTSGSNNVAIGYNAGYAETTGTQNTWIGSGAGQSQVGANNNSYFGFNTGVSATGSENTALGRAAFANAGAAAQVTAVGAGAGRYISGNSNVSLGYFALAGVDSVSTGASNVAVGSSALRLLTTANYNIAVGTQAGYSVTTGGNNFFGGYQAGYSQSTAINNVMVGYQAGYNITSGSNSALLGYLAGGSGATTAANLTYVGALAGIYQSGGNNTGIGHAALYGVQSASNAINNTALGYYAGFAVTTGGNSVYVGHQAGTSNTTGASNVFVGLQAGYVNSVGNYNTYIGNTAAASSTTGSFNVVVGHQAGASAVNAWYLTYLGVNSGFWQTGGNNTAIGHNALAGSSGASATNNTAIGKEAGQAVTTGGNNFFGGYQAGYSQSTAINNVMVGYQAGYNVTSGSNNTFIGHTSGQSTTTGANNTFLGYGAGNTTTTGNNNIYLGVNSTGTANNNTNETVIGFTATGRGSNTTTIGNGSITLTLIPSGSLALAGTAAGTNAVSLGLSNSASSNYTVALGQSNTANNTNAVAIGRSNTSSGTDSTAIGAGNISSGTGTAAIGASNTSSGTQSVAAGFSNTASNFFSIALGAYNASSGFYSFAAGGTNTASGTSSVAMGQFSLASGAQSIAMGNASTGSFPGTIAIGSGSLASSTESIALGAKNTASGPNAVSIGNNSTASFTGSISIGAFNTASGQSAAAIGGSNIATGGYGFAAGYNSTASGFGSISMGGGGNVANTAFAMAFGSTNTASGTAASAMGTNNTASGASSIAHGQYSLASGAQSVAIGSYVTGSNTSAVAIGVSNVASGQNAVAIGNGNTASSTTSIAIGNTNTASTGIYAVAIGQANSASGIASVAIGNANSSVGDNSFTSGRSARGNSWGQRAHAAGLFASTGDAQISTLVARASTADASVTELFLDGSGASQRAVLPASTTWDAEVTIVARSSGGTSNASFKRRCMIKRDASNNTVLVGPVQVVGSDIGSNFGSPPTGWAVTLSADDTNESLKMEVTGAAATNIRWVAKIELTEVGFA